MQLAINAVILAVAFAAVAKPAQFRKAINQLLKELRLITNGLTLVKYGSEQDKTPFFSEDMGQERPGASAELLTRFVRHWPRTLLRLTC